MSGLGRAGQASPVSDRELAGLYVITAELPALGRTHEGLAALALAGGARLVQFREKRRDAPGRRAAAAAVRRLCRRFGALCIVNDDPALAEEIDADGLHLGQSDLDALAAWPRRGKRPRLLGISVATVAEARRAVALGADYLGVGPVFATPSKADAGAPIGLAGLRAIRAAVDLPLAAVGGVCAANAEALLAAGADALCVISAVATAPDPQAAAQALTELCAARRPASGRLCGRPSLGGGGHD